LCRAPIMIYPESKSQSMSVRSRALFCIVLETCLPYGCFLQDSGPAMKKVRTLGIVAAVGALPALGVMPSHAGPIPTVKTPKKTVSLNHGQQQPALTCGTTHEVSVSGPGKDPAFQFWSRLAGASTCIGTVKARGFGPAGASAWRIRIYGDHIKDYSRVAHDSANNSTWGVYVYFPDPVEICVAQQSSHLKWYITCKSRH
jgi:hypothetical protein